MARYFTRANLEYFGASGAVVSDEPMTLACWYYPVQVGIDVHLFGFNNDTSSLHYQEINIRAADDFHLATSRSGSTQVSAASAAISVNQWNHCCAVFAAANDRRAYLNGGNKGTESSTRNPTLNYTTIGALNNGGSPSANSADGRVAECAIWNVALTDKEVGMLAAGVSPIRVRPGSLVAYYPLPAFTGNAIDYSGNNNTLADISTVTTASHAPVAPMFAFDLYTGETLVVAASETIEATLQDSLAFTDQSERDGIFTR
jgi:hypothetical protein